MNTITSIIQFELPEKLACPKPTEDRGLNRDEVRLMITSDSHKPIHTQFNQLDEYLKAGDVLVVNTSATVASALPIELPNERKGRLHISTQLSDHQLLIEIREVIADKTTRWNEGVIGQQFKLPNGVKVVLKEKYYENRELLNLWVAEYDGMDDLGKVLANYGLPIQYEKLDVPKPLEYYQTAFSFQSGSAEMPSAARGFTPELVERLIKKGVEIVPILLHTGVSSLEENETPYPEYMEIDPISAMKLNIALEEGRTIIATGTTAVRAVESAVDKKGRVESYKGMTSLYIKENHEMKVISGLLTGFHEPKASHLNMLQALAGYNHIEEAYEIAIQQQYYWHQFGDLHLILP